MTRHLSARAIVDALTLRDLTDPAQGPHAMQRLLDEIEAALADRWAIPVRRHRAHRIVPVEDNYDRLLIPADAVARDVRYTRYVNDSAILRTHTSTMIPGLLPPVEPEVVLSCPGLVYRRDVVDRRHVGEPHQVDLWRIRARGPSLAEPDLDRMVALVVEAAVPGARHRTVPVEHPYTLGGRQIDVRAGDEWIEVGECGLAHPALLAAGGLPEGSGLAIGLGLDRLVMLRKGIEDIRALRSTDPRIAEQMLDLEPYRPVSAMPPVRRDVSLAVAEGTDAEELGDRARTALGKDAAALESLDVVSETPLENLPESARLRLGISLDQKNVLVRIVLRHLERTLTDREANELCNRLSDSLHEGTERVWAPNGGDQ